MKKIVLTLLFACLTVSIQAQVKQISPDRPGIGNTSVTLDRSQVMIESGLSLSQFDGDADPVYSIGQLRARFGVAPRFEVITALNSYLSSDAFDGGFEDASLGIKINFFQIPAFALPPDGSSRTDMYQHIAFNMSFVAEASFATGASSVSADESTYRFGVFADYVPYDAVYNRWSVSSNFLLFLDDIDGNDEMLLTLTPAFAINPQERLNMYFGYAGYFGGVVDRSYLELGFMASSFAEGRLQLDINSGYDFENDGYFVGAGLAVLLN